MTDCADMDCSDCIWEPYQLKRKSDCSRYKTTPEDRARRKLLKASIPNRGFENE